MITADGTAHYLNFQRPFSNPPRCCSAAGSQPSAQVVPYLLQGRAVQQGRRRCGRAEGL